MGHTNWLLNVCGTIETIVSHLLYVDFHLVIRGAVLNEKYVHMYPDLGNGIRQLIIIDINLASYLVCAGRNN